MKRISRRMNIQVIFTSIFILGLSFIGNLAKVVDAKAAFTNSNQTENFNSDLKTANSYWSHNKLGSAYFRNGEYEKSIEEYKAAIHIIENIPGEHWKDVSVETMDRINKESCVSKQLFSRYGLIKALEGAGRYDEAVQNVDWLLQNQKIKGKEERLKQKLEGMKQGLLQKMNA